VSYNPLQPRGQHGRWVAKGVNAGVRAATKEAAKSNRNKIKKVGPVSLHSVSSKVVKRERGVGLSGLKQNTVPYIRVNKRSQTIGVNAGTRIPGTHKRVVVGGYSRLESTRKQTGVDRVAGRAVGKIAPPNTRRGKTVAAFRNNFAVTSPAVRGSVKGAQVRLGTSRGAGPTLIVRRGKHKTPQAKSQTGIAKYDASMRKIAGAKSGGVKKARPQRRRAARKRK
jgi:hypothetical protein